MFVGGWTLEAAEAICAAPDERRWPCWTGCRRWSSSSWCGTVPRPAARARYRMLETLREYAQERLAADGDRGGGRTPPCRLLPGAGETAAAKGINGPEQVAWLDRLEREQGNLRAAFQWALARGETLSCACAWRPRRSSCGSAAGSFAKGSARLKSPWRCRARSPCACARRRCWRRRK